MGTLNPYPSPLELGWIFSWNSGKIRLLPLRRGYGFAKRAKCPHGEGGDARKARVPTLCGALPSAHDGEEDDEPYHKGRELW
jgi:hypothetical protein